MPRTSTCLRKVSIALLVFLVIQGAVGFAIYYGLDSARNAAPSALDRTQLPLFLLIATSISAIVAGIIVFCCVRHTTTSPDEHSDQIVQRMAHDLRSPLMYIKGRLQLAKRSENQENDPGELLAELTTELQTLECLIADFALFSKVANAGTRSPLGIVDVNDLVMEAVDQCLDAAGNKGIRIRPTLVEATDERSSPLVNGEKTWLLGMLTRLLRHAIDRNEGDLPVDIEVVLEPRIVTVKVCDRGRTLGSEERNQRIEAMSQSSPRLWKTPSQSSVVVAAMIAHFHQGAIETGDGPKGGVQTTIQIPVATRES